MLRAYAVLALSTALLLGCGGHSRPAVPATYTVKRGDTVYAIAWRHNLDYRALARWNQLPSDYRIYPGQVLRLYPPPGYREPATPRRAAPASPAPKAPAPPLIPAKERVAAWVWPVEAAAATIRSTSAPGLLIGGEEGQPVRAAAPGRVVYTGSGLRGFGQLVIIKHTEVFLSAYGHNRQLAVKEGDQVMAGQTIAEMGLGPRQEAALYFEIRLNGRPVDPLALLPRR